MPRRRLNAFSASGKSLLVLANFLSLPTCGARQNRLIRTNRTRRACLVSTPVGNSSTTLCSPRLCALCVKFLMFGRKSVSRNPSAGRAANSRGICTYDLAKPKPFVMNTCIKNTGGGYPPHCEICRRDVTESRGNFRFHYTALARVAFHYASRRARFFAHSRHSSFRLSTFDCSQLQQNPHLHKKREGVPP